MDMEKLLTGLFDYQRFEQSPALKGVLDEVEARHFSEELSDDALKTLFAAGDPYSQTPDPRRKDGPP